MAPFNPRQNNRYRVGDIVTRVRSGPIVIRSVSLEHITEIKQILDDVRFMDISDCLLYSYEFRPAYDNEIKRFRERPAKSFTSPEHRIFYPGAVVVKILGDNTSTSNREGYITEIAEIWFEKNRMIDRKNNRHYLDHFRLATDEEVHLYMRHDKRVSNIRQFNDFRNQAEPRISSAFTHERSRPDRTFSHGFGDPDEHRYIREAFAGFNQPISFPHFDLTFSKKEEKIDSTLPTAITIPLNRKNKIKRLI
jgi:hypothetical protein